MNEKIVNVTVGNYDKVVVESEKPVILDIGASWCRDCIRIKPLFEEFAEKYSDKFLFAECNFDTESELNEKFNVRHIPTLILLEKGEIKDMLVEPKNVKLFQDFMDKALAK